MAESHSAAAASSSAPAPAPAAAAPQQAEPSPAQPSDHQAEATFKKFSAEQATHYRKMRGVYPAALYDYMLAYHDGSGGGRSFVVDVGCGPGNATADLGAHFDRVLGVDHSAGMVDAARKLGSTTRTGQPIEYRVSTAEGLDEVEGIAPGSVDFVSSGTAAHWFDMPKFWAAAAKILKPGGTVALYTYSKSWLHPSTPNRDQVQAEMDHLYDEILGPFDKPSNILVSHHYADLVLPWTEARCPPDVKDAFEQSTFVSKIWDLDGRPADGQFFGRNMEATFPAMEAYFASSSPYQRWREANPDLADTDQDVAKVMLRRARGMLQIPPGEEDTYKLKSGMTTVCLLVKRAKE